MLISDNLYDKITNKTIQYIDALDDQALKETVNEFTKLIKGLLDNGEIKCPLVQITDNTNNKEYQCYNHYHHLIDYQLNPNNIDQNFSKGYNKESLSKYKETICKILHSRLTTLNSKNNDGKPFYTTYDSKDVYYVFEHVLNTLRIAYTIILIEKENQHEK